MSTAGGGALAGLRLWAPPGVYRPRSDTALLAAVLTRMTPPPGDALDLCTGTGALALVAARLGHRVTAVDRSRRAVAAARLNARRNGVRLRVRRGDLLGPVAGRRFDLILANPPYLPAPPGTGSVGGARAWDAGVDGRALLERICADAPAYLRPGGRIVLVQSDLAGEAATHAALAAAGLTARTLASVPGPLGPIAAARAAYLAARGLVAEGREGERLVVIEATRRAVSVSCSGVRHAESRRAAEGGEMSQIEESIKVSVPVRTAYDQWTQFQEFPEFMEGVKEIRQIDDTHTHWVVSVAGNEREFDAEITEQIPDERIAWTSTDGPDHAGVVTFHRIADGETQIMLQMDGNPGSTGEKMADAAGLVRRRVRGDLERFKEMIEARGAGGESGAWRGEVRQDPTR